MGNPKPPGSDASGGAQELCVNCGMPPIKEEETIPITLLFSKVSRQVLCVEAGKDFVDMLMGFLTLPISCMVRFLAEATMIHKPEVHLTPLPTPPVTFPATLPYTPGPKRDKDKFNEHFAMSAISNVFDSVVRLEEDRMCVDKKCLLEAKPGVPFGAGKLLDLSNTPKSGDESTQGSSSYGSPMYGCGMACSFATGKMSTKCPKHKKKMENLFRIVEDMPGDPNDPQNTRGGGYVKAGTEFMITNTLEIFANSAIKALITLNMIRSERVGDLDTMEVFVVATEVLQLLKASFTSTNVLNEVFGKYCANAKGAAITDKNQFFFPQCGDTPCCQCSRSPAQSNSSNNS